MTPVPIELPFKANEAGKLAEVVLEHAEGQRITGVIRGRIGVRVASLRFTSLQAFPGSLQRDPVHPSTYYLVADPQGPDSHPRLLRLALDSSPSSGLFPSSLLIGRIRTDSNREVVVNAIPFAPSDRRQIQTFAEKVDRDFLPRVTGAAPSIEVPVPDFEAYRKILKASGANLAAVRASLPDAEAIWHEAVWRAIRSGWREGWSASLAIASVAQSVEAASLATRFTRFSIPAGPGTLQIQAALLALRRQCDWELDFHHLPSETTPAQVTEALQLLRSQSRPAQFVAPRIDPRPANTFEARLAALHEAARQGSALLSLSGPLDTQDTALIGKVTGGRVNYKGTGDVLQIAGLLRP